MKPAFVGFGSRRQHPVLIHSASSFLTKSNTQRYCFTDFDYFLRLLSSNITPPSRLRLPGSSNQIIATRHRVAGESRGWWRMRYDQWRRIHSEAWFLPNEKQVKQPTSAKAAAALHRRDGPRNNAITKDGSDHGAAMGRRVRADGGNQSSSYRGSGRRRAGDAFASGSSRLHQGDELCMERAHHPKMPQVGARQPAKRGLHPMSGCRDRGSLLMALGSMGVGIQATKK